MYMLFAFRNPHTGVNFRWQTLKSVCLHLRWMDCCFLSHSYHALRLVFFSCLRWLLPYTCVCMLWMRAKKSYLLMCYMYVVCMYILSTGSLADPDICGQNGRVRLRGGWLYRSVMFTCTLSMHCIHRHRRMGSYVKTWCMLRILFFSLWVRNMFTNKPMRLYVEGALISDHKPVCFYACEYGTLHVTRYRVLHTYRAEYLANGLSSTRHLTHLTTQNKADVAFHTLGMWACRLAEQTVGHQRKVEGWRETEKGDLSRLVAGEERLHSAAITDKWKITSNYQEMMWCRNLIVVTTIIQEQVGKITDQLQHE